MRKFFLIFLVILASSLPAATGPEYSIQAIRYASAKDEVAGLVMGAPKGEKINIAMVVWLIRGGGRNIARQRVSHFAERRPDGNAPRRPAAAPS